jgi:hypothetical protein
LLVGCAWQASVFDLPENFEMFRVSGLEHLAKLFIVQQTLLTAVVVPVQLNDSISIRNIDPGAILEIFEIVYSEPPLLPFVYIVEYTERVEPTAARQFSAAELQGLFFIQ